ncbi:erythromycin esterase family protein [Pseudoduganella umbonata]|uniref:Erythromycin esterase family protein n=1 Tax=Pseudoduganella umbonata TaxID=864828 RepID=A0A4P8HMB9_9BURK|nr:erythromycin esterase family protein [Pseudoduganella umbonata]MBB3219397.1 erythromycin esterase-like protein [Pseudoduganella umbonata]QCP09488.1 erythromycin esterase family protein [Pseudoduganella umbonata]
MTDRKIIDALKGEARPLSAGEDFDYLLESIGDASIVLLGEATHGTREFYRLRAEISKRLIVEKGFDAIAVEADWPDALRVSRYVQHGGDDMTAEGALSGYKRFPQWMWRNHEIVDLVNWLRLHNAHVASSVRRVGFYGLDLYSLRQSMDAVIAYLDKEDPEAADRARQRYGCIDHMAEDPQEYGYATTFGMKPHCEQEVMRQLTELTRQATLHMKDTGGQVPDELFYAQQNARVARNAETYYRSMFQSRDESWNVRDSHMAETLEALREHISQRTGRPGKIVVWAHNSHLGDARATEMGEHGQLNLGQLVRERYRPDDIFLLGFTTHTGTVTAATEWDGPAELKPVVASRPDSVERLMHETSIATGMGQFLLPLRGHDSMLARLPSRYLERAIGVIYRPDTERYSHYFHADAARQFDALVHVDRSTALPPLERSALWQQDEMPETYPSGL